MNTYKTLIVAGSAILSTLAFSNAALAGEWTSQAFSPSQPQNEQLFAATSDNTAITFTCVNTKLRVAISAENNEADKITSSFNEARGKRMRKVDLMIDGELVPTKKWLNASRNQIFVTPDRASSAKIYNAALKQQPISIQSKYLEKTDLSFPALNEDFTKFGAGCGLGTLKAS